jgi:N,N-dimethylformamidase
MDVCVSYRRLEASYTSPVAWIFEDVVADLIGDFGLAKGGAAGLEVDRYDRHLGTPPHTVILAHSSELSDNYQLTQEDVMSTLPGLGGSENSLVRADMTYFTTSNHGAVFSASSIAWGSALPVNNFDNNVAQIMRNVVNQFLNDGALPGSDWMIGRLKLS